MITKLHFPMEDGNHYRQSFALVSHELVKSYKIIGRLNYQNKNLMRQIKELRSSKVICASEIKALTLVMILISGL